MEKILIISAKNDPHANSITQALNKRGFESERIYVDHFPASGELSLKITSDGKYNLKIADKNISSIKSVYCRPYPNDIFNISHQSQIINRFLHRESYALLKMIWETLRSEKTTWINPWGASEVAENKGLQMRLAISLGFRIPKTLITGSREEAISFIRQAKNNGNKVVLKTITGFTNQVSNERGGAFVTVIEEDKLGNLNYPLVLQEYIQKEYELRITVVGDQVFPCKITSQDSPNEVTKIDWRIYDFKNVKFLPAQIPSNIAERCIQLTRLLGLQYSAIDIIYEPNGNFRFLELNPNGLWLWIEELAQLPITEAIAELLVKNN